MANSFFQFKQFTIYHDRCAMKVTTDGCLFGAWCATDIQKAKHNQQILLDIGTGTGLLSLMVAQKANVKIDSVEIDAFAVQQAKENMANSPFSDKIVAHHQDIRCWNGEPYDYIISNPPFYENELRSENENKNIAHHSEALSLKQLLRIISKHLKDDGCFYLLLPYKRYSEIVKLVIQERLFLTTLVIVHPTSLHAPFRLLLKGSKQEKAMTEQHFFIKEADGAYSPAFVELLKDYYLYL